MQVAKYRAELNAGLEHLLNGQVFSPGFTQVFLQRIAFDEVHHEVPAPSFAKIIIDGGNIGMLQTREQVSFTFESLDGLGYFLLTQAALPHLFDGHKPVAKERISRFINCSEAAPTNLFKNTIAFLEQVILNKRSSGGADREATHSSL